MYLFNKDLKYIKLNFITNYINLKTCFIIMDSSMGSLAVIIIALFLIGIFIFIVVNATQGAGIP